MIFHYRTLKRSMLDLLDEVKDLLPQDDIHNAREMVEYNEYGIGFEIVCGQLFEYDVKITPAIYKKIVTIGKSMKMSETSWNFLKPLITND